MAAADASVAASAISGAGTAPGCLVFVGAGLAPAVLEPGLEIGLVDAVQAGQRLAYLKDGAGFREGLNFRPLENTKSAA